MPLNTIVIVVLLAQIPGSQYPGQYPGQYPPGQYPQGRNPGIGFPMPGGGKKTTTSSSKEQQSAPSYLFKGLIRQLDGKSLELEADDSRIIAIQLNDKTVKPKDLAAGDSGDVTAKEDGKGGYIAIEIRRTSQAVAASDPAPDAKAGSRDPVAPVELKGPKYDEGDSGPPTLRRGKPLAKNQTLSSDMPVVSSPPPSVAPVPEERAGAVTEAPRAVPSDPRMAFIERARDEAGNFLTGLPNYVCQEHTTRYVSEGKSWHALDLVSLDLVYEDGKEKYQNLAINGKKSNKPAEESGAWSTGEFGTVLADLFHPGTQAKFKYIKDSTASGMAAAVYDFSVDRAHSHWRVVFSSQTILPSYKGSIWLDKKSARVLRIEMEATNIPNEFPASAVESAVDYGYVSLGTEKFFLPTHAEILSCQRGMNVCSRNVIEFRNYHRFAGESNIIFK